MAVTIDRKNATKEQIDAALKLLQKAEERKEKIKKGELKGSRSWSEMSPEAKKKALEASRRRNAKLVLLAKKAMEKGITVTEKEIDDYMA